MTPTINDRIAIMEEQLAARTKIAASINHEGGFDAFLAKTNILRGHIGGLREAAAMQQPAPGPEKVQE